MKAGTGAPPDPQRFLSLSEAGAKNAAAALSQIIGRPLTLEVPWAKAVPLEAVPEIAGGASRVVCALSLRIYGGLRGNLLLLFGGIAGTAREGSLTELERSALSEVGNIMAAAYLNALSDLLGASLLPSIPALAIDMLGAVTDFLQIEMAPLTDTALVLASEVREPASGLKGEFFFLPDPSDYQAMAGCSEGGAHPRRSAR
jgi:chemotaxis protein CheC